MRIKQKGKIIRKFKFTRKYYLIFSFLLVYKKSYMHDNSEKDINFFKVWVEFWICETET